MGEIFIAVFIGIWLSGAAFLSYRFLKKENQNQDQKDEGDRV